MFKFTHEKLNQMVLDALTGKPETPQETTDIEKVIEVMEKGQGVERGSTEPTTQTR